MLGRRREIPEYSFSQMEQQEMNIEEAFVLLDLIDAEFRTDPMSTQCFDLRIVERVRVCVEKRRSGRIL